MKRFIEHEELARDSRFIRGNNAQATIIASLPDDVDAVVNAIDPMAAIIEEGVRGTAAEPLYDAYGPGFIFTILNEPLDPEAPAALTRLLFRMHGIFVGELQALEGAARGAGAEIRLGAPVLSVERDGDLWVARTEDAATRARASTSSACSSRC